MGMEKKGGERKKRRLRQKKVTAVQKLYDACRDVFADCGPGVVPAADGIERLKEILSKFFFVNLGFFFYLHFDYNGYGYESWFISISMCLFVVFAYGSI